jgi:RimJ/RimL family protein N-acetyltransferase
VVRSIRPDDFRALLSYANDLITEDTFIMLSGNPLTPEEEQSYLDDAIRKVMDNRKIHLVIEVNGHFAGSSEVRIFDKRKSHVGEIGISLAADYRDEGIGFVCLETLIGEAKKLGLRMLTLTCFETNERAIHTYEKAGFIKAGVIPELLSYKGKYIGEILMYLPLI